MNMGMELNNPLTEQEVERLNELRGMIDVFATLKYWKNFYEERCRDLQKKVSELKAENEELRRQNDDLRKVNSAIEWRGGRAFLEVSPQEKSISLVQEYGGEKWLIAQITDSNSIRYFPSIIKE